MAQSVRLEEMEEYIRRLGELLNLVHKKMLDDESKRNTLEADLARLRKEVEALKNENMGHKDNATSKREYDEFVNCLIESLKGLLTETPREGISEDLPVLPEMETKVS
jgi:chromosome segregation ATPase